MILKDNIIDNSETVQDFCKQKSKDRGAPFRAHKRSAAKRRACSAALVLFGCVGTKSVYGGLKSLRQFFDKNWWNCRRERHSNFFV